MYFSRFEALADPMLNAVCLTMLVSFVCLSVIRLLDIIADDDRTGDNVDDAIKQIIKAIGILVGFGWEQCFDQAVVSLSSATSDPHISKLVLGLFCVSIVTPAWKWYLLPMALKDGWKFGFVIDMDCPAERFEDIVSHLDEKKEKVGLQHGLTVKLDGIKEFSKQVVTAAKAAAPTKDPKKSSSRDALTAPLLSEERQELEQLRIAQASHEEALKSAEKGLPPPSREFGTERFSSNRKSSADAARSLKEQVETLENLTKSLLGTKLMQTEFPTEQA